MSDYLDHSKIPPTSPIHCGLALDNAKQELATPETPQKSSSVHLSSPTGEKLPSAELPSSFVGNMSNSGSVGLDHQPKTFSEALDLSLEILDGNGRIFKENRNMREKMKVLRAETDEADKLLEEKYRELQKPGNRTPEKEKAFNELRIKTNLKKAEMWNSYFQLREHNDKVDQILNQSLAALDISGHGVGEGNSSSQESTNQLDLNAEKPAGNSEKDDPVIIDNAGLENVDSTEEEHAD